MQSVRLHVAANGVVWALSQCAGCGDLDKHLSVEAALGPIPCKKCGRLMSMQGATVEAVEAADELKFRTHGDIPAITSLPEIAAINNEPVDFSRIIAALVAVIAAAKARQASGDVSDDYTTLVRHCRNMHVLILADLAQREGNTSRFMLGLTETLGRSIERLESAIPQRIPRV